MYITHDTIFSLSTSAQKSALALIRISGPDALLALELFSVRKTILPNQAIYARLYEGDIGFVDDVVITYFASPRTFTSEDMLEICCHGSPVVIKVICEVLSRKMRQALRGEFIMRAFVNGKIDLTQAEGINDVMEAQTVEQLRQSNSQMRGNLKSKIDNYRSEIVNILSLIEADIDFSDQDLPQDTLDRYQMQTQLMVNEISKALNDDSFGEKVREGFYIPIVGKTNAGKSSLINCLVKRDIAIVSSIHGTTRDIKEAYIDLGGYLVVLVDTAGLRETQDEIEKMGINLAKKACQSADIVIVMIEKGDEDKADLLSILIDDVSDYKRMYPVYVTSKFDTAIDVTSMIDGREYINISSHKGIGIETLTDKIRELINQKVPKNQDLVLTNQRHRSILIRIVNILKEVDFALSREIVAWDLWEVASLLSEITNPIVHSEILESIFSNFCIGK